MTRRTHAILIALVSALLLWPAAAAAGGLFLPVHGVRGMSRAGAFIAGADDPSGIWYNPATVDRSGGWQLLADVTIMVYNQTYERVDSGGNALPAVSNESVPLPVPTIALTAPLPLWGDRLWFGVSFSAPFGTIPSYPRPNYGLCGGALEGCIHTVHTDAPQRYSLISFNGTLFLRLDLAVAIRVVPQLTVGVSLQNTFAKLSQLKAISSYNAALGGGPEQPELDVLSQVEMLDMFNPSARFGVTYRPHPAITIGAMFQMPVWINAGAKLDVQLPASPLYEPSTVVGSKAKVSLQLPFSAGLGVEVRPIAGLRLELDFVFENWKTLDKIAFTPEDIKILDLPGVGDYQVGPIAEELNFRDTFSFRFGAEYTLAQLPLTLRGGYGFERGAARLEYLSVVAIDGSKHLLTVGAGYRFGRVRVDVVYGLAFTPDRVVDYTASLSKQINPIKPRDAVMVGGGRYTQFFHFAGAGMNMTF